MPFLFAAGGIERKQALVSGTQVRVSPTLITSLVISPGSFGASHRQYRTRSFFQIMVIGVNLFQR